MRGRRPDRSRVVLTDQGRVWADRPRQSRPALLQRIAYGGGPITLTIRVSTKNPVCKFVFSFVQNTTVYPSWHVDGHVQRFRGGLVFKAHRLLYHPTLGLKLIKKKKKLTATRFKELHSDLGNMRVRFRVNMAHIRQWRPDSGLGFKVKVRITLDDKSPYNVGR